MRTGERNLMILFLVLAGGATAIAFSFQRPEARIFPLITGFTTTFFVVAYFVINGIPALREKLHAYIEDDIFMKITAASDLIEAEEAEEAAETTHKTGDLPLDVRHSREIRVFGYLGGFLLLAFLAGLTVAAPAVLLALMIGYSKKSWALSLTVTAATSAFMYVVFVVVLRLPLHLGVLGGLF